MCTQGVDGVEQAQESTVLRALEGEPPIWTDDLACARRHSSIGTPSPRSSPGSRAICTIAFVSVLRNLGLPVTGIVAPATAIDFGAQRLVQDLLAGVFIIAENQYAFGDTVTLTLTGANTTEALSRTLACGPPSCGRTTGRW